MIAKASLKWLVPSVLIDGAANIQSKDLDAAPSMSGDGIIYSLFEVSVLDTLRIHRHIQV